MSVLIQALMRAQAEMGAGGPSTRASVLPGSRPNLGLPLLAAVSLAVLGALWASRMPARVVREPLPAGVLVPLASFPTDEESPADPPEPAAQPLPDPAERRSEPEPRRLASHSVQGPDSAVLPPSRPPKAATPPASAPASVQARAAPPQPAATAVSGWQPKVRLAEGVPGAALRGIPTVTGDPIAELRSLLPDGGMRIAVRLHRENVARGREVPPPVLPPPAEAATLRAALALLEAARARAPGAAAPLVQKALVEAGLGDFPAAIEDMRDAVGLAPEQASYRAAYAILLDRIGRRDEAIRQYEEAQRLVLDADGWRTPLPVTLTEMRQRIEALRRA